MRLRRSDLFTDDAFAEAVEAKLVNVRYDGYGLAIANYSDAAMYTPGAWDNPAVRACRGLIYLDSLLDPVVVARPWAKFFNHGQAEADTLSLSEPVEVTDKIDGSLGILHLDHRDQPRVATRGSFTSEQALHATNLLHTRPEWLPDPRILRMFTVLVEIVYPENRIVVDYHGADTLILLGAVHIDSGRYLGPAEAVRFTDWQGPVTETYGEYPTLREALSAPPRRGAEGLVVRALGQTVDGAGVPMAKGRIVKLKQDDYVALHRLVTGLSERVVWAHLVDQQPLEDLLAPLPDELHLWVKAVAGQLLDAATAKVQHAQGVKHAIEDELGMGWTRKDFAAEAAKFHDTRAWLFQLIDGRDPYLPILEKLKPAGAVRARLITEDVA